MKTNHKRGGGNKHPFYQRYNENDDTPKWNGCHFALLNKSMVYRAENSKWNGKRNILNATPAIKNNQSKPNTQPFLNLIKSVVYTKWGNKPNKKPNTSNHPNTTPSFHYHVNLWRVIGRLLLCGSGFVGYIKDLSKTTSVTPQRHRGFFVPVFSASQADTTEAKQHLAGLYQSMVQSVHTSYGWVTLQNKPYGKYAGRYLVVPRVNPPTLLTLFNSVVSTQKQQGGNHA